MHLPDINIWLALAFESHAHHREAKDWFDGTNSESCAFCRLTQIGFLRLATNPKAFPTEAVTMAGAWDLYDAFASDERVVFATDPVGIEKYWRIFTSTKQFSPKVWNDAYLAAIAVAGQMKLVSCDGGFSKYGGLEHLTLGS